MRREEAIEVLKKTLPYESDFAEARVVAIEALEYIEKHKDILDLVNVFAELGFDTNKIIWSAQEWIPCSERLPKEDGDVICCTDAKEVFIASYLGKLDDGSECFDDDNGMMCEGNIIAWMPLPEPYKGEKK